MVLMPLMVVASFIKYYNSLCYYLGLRPPLLKQKGSYEVSALLCGQRKYLHLFFNKNSKPTVGQHLYHYQNFFLVFCIARYYKKCIFAAQKNNAMAISTENITSQMRKGILEYCILLIINKKPAYVSDIISELKEAHLIVVEGTLYPLLSRLKNGGLLSYQWQESVQAPLACITSLPMMVAFFSGSWRTPGMISVIPSRKSALTAPLSSHSSL